MNGAFVAAFDNTFKYMVAAAVVGAVLGLALRHIRTPQASGAVGAGSPQAEQAGVRNVGVAFGG